MFPLCCFLCFCLHLIRYPLSISTLFTHCFSSSLLSPQCAPACIHACLSQFLRTYSASSFRCFFSAFACTAHKLQPLSLTLPLVFCQSLSCVSQCFSVILSLSLIFSPRSMFHRLVHLSSRPGPFLFGCNLTAVVDTLDVVKRRLGWAAIAESRETFL